MLGYRPHGKAFVRVALIDVLQRNLDLFLTVTAYGTAGRLAPEGGQLVFQLLPVETLLKLLVGFPP